MFIKTILFKQFYYYDFDIGQSPVSKFFYVSFSKMNILFFPNISENIRRTKILVLWYNPNF